MFLLIRYYSFSQADQKVAGTRQASEADTAKLIAATPTKSALSYDAMAQFVQSTVTTGTNGGFNFRSTLFGFNYLFAKNGKKDSLSSYYLRHTSGRNTEISLGFNKSNTSSDQLSRITAGIKFAVSNRDKSVKNFAVEAGILDDIKNVDHAMVATKIIYTTRNIIDRIFKDNIKQPDQLKKAIAASLQLNNQFLSKGGLNNWQNSDIEAVLTSLNIDQATINNIESQFAAVYPSTVTANNKAYKDSTHKTKLDPDFKKIGDSVFLATYKLSYDIKYEGIEKKYNDLAKRIDMGSLLTFSLNPGYNIQFTHWDTTSFSVRYLIGLGKNLDKPWNLDIQAIGVSQQDSSATRQNFSHNKLKFSLGFDKVFARDSKDNPLLEAEFAGEYDNVVTGKYMHEQKEMVTANLVTSIHLSKQFTLPLTLKYAPKKSNLFGFLSVQWNLENSEKSGGAK